MFHTLAFYEAITNASIYAEVSGVFDPVVPMDAASRFLIQQDLRIDKAYASGVNLTAARIQAPTLLSLAYPEIYPANDTADVPTVDTVVDYYGHGPVIPRNDPLSVAVSRGGADAQPCVCALWMRKQFTPAPAGPSYKFPYTFTITLVAGSWTAGTLTAVQQLPTGLYAVIGAQVLCNDAILARFVFPAQQSVPEQQVMRPGVLVQDAYGDLTLMDPFGPGKMGTFGVFDSVAPPSIEILGDAAGAESGLAYLDLVRIR